VKRPLNKKYLRRSVEALSNSACMAIMEAFSPMVKLAVEKLSQFRVENKKRCVDYFHDVLSIYSLKSQR
jgi:hypothetical protein